MISFYQENKINPFASCIPLLLQLPVFLALYQLLNSGTFKDEMRADPPIDFFFINDLTEKATGGPLVALIILFIATQLGASAVMAGRAEGTQRTIMFVLPFAFAPFVITFPAGLAVYWISTNVWTLGQQLVVKHVLPAATGADGRGVGGDEASAPTAAEEEEAALRRTHPASASSPLREVLL